MEEVFEAYFACRRKKRGTHNALAFEADYERKCIGLWREINAGTYKPSRSVAFIVFKPVQREVFAADFRDRVVHHLIARKIEPLLEAEFIDDSYSTRKEKGTLYGIRRVEGFVRECSENYTKDCYVMKLDIRSFFMDISKKLLYERLEKFLRETYRENDLPMLLYLLRETIFNRPEKNCIRRCPATHWKGLPWDKEPVPFGRKTRTAHRESDEPDVGKFLPESARPPDYGAVGHTILRAVCGRHGTGAYQQGIPIGEAQTHPRMAGDKRADPASPEDVSATLRQRHPVYRRRGETGTDIHQ